MPIDELLVSENVVDTTKELVKLILPAPESRSADTIKHINVFYNFFGGEWSRHFPQPSEQINAEKVPAKSFQGLCPRLHYPKVTKFTFFTGLYLNLGYFHKLCQ